MARRKNTRKFDPRYFMDEKTETVKEENNPIANIDTRKAVGSPQPIGTGTRKVPGQANPAAVKASAQKIQATLTALQTQLKALFGALGEAKISFEHLIIETGNLEEGG